MNSRSDAENSHRESEHSQSAVIRRDAAENVEICILAIYSVQLWFWNYLDFIMVCGGILDLWLLPLDSDMALPDETGPIEAHELAQRRRELAQGLRALAVGRDPPGRRREEARDPPQAIREHIAGNSRSDADFCCVPNLGAAF